jgi:transcriptional regulator with XRE-family HTH domain
MPLIVQAITRQMETRGENQPQVSKATGVSQSEVSRILAGERRKVTDHVRALCKYAGIDVDADTEISHVQQRLSQAVRGAIGDNAMAAQALTRILEALTPVLRDYQPDPAPIVPGDDHDNVRTR